MTLLFALACQPADGLGPGAALEPFALEDVNPNSASFGAVVATDSVAARTGWYFGHAT